MPRRIEQINELLKKALGEIIQKELDTAFGLITVIYVECSKDLRYADIAFTVLPDLHEKRALSALVKNNPLFKKELGHKTRMPRFPKLRWKIDETEKKAAAIEELLRNISK
jgi:ribosome-binding factor A